ncbi:type VI secretion system membrane subunit TssM [Vibrio mediterranei]|uniref:type VI secretion system membrane subunit TssM n=1 Tax=Vibrio mediterranei TaxID=689 RepID=UPI00148BAFF5|nr:type VI secretion system membrane subunit TssM [Vibrio mediterranei]NOI25099.1 type VI secretion system membrane subunit TssM [Vibrio mediterranei]
MTKPTEKNKKHSLIWAIMLTLLLWLIGGGLTWWLGYLHYLTLSLVTTVFTGLGCGLVCYWLMQHNSQGNKTPDQQRLLIHKRCKLLAMHFERVIEIQKRKKRLNSHYDHPIYLLLSSALCKDKPLITQMGYEAYQVDDFGNDIEFPVLFWLNEHSIMISISCGEDQQAQYLKTLIKCLNKWRPRQAINGMLLTTEVETLLGNREELIQRADDLKSTIKTFNNSFGLNVPIYNLVTNMGLINDFCHFFSAFDEAKRNHVFGATSPYIKNGGINADWFNEEYDHLIRQLITSTSTALSSQLNQDYRNSICAAPYQFGLLKQSLWHFLQRLYRGDQLNNGLCFRGFYFTHSGVDTKQYDLLANVINESLGNEKFQQQHKIPVTQTLFAQHIINHVVLNESFLVGVNRRKENMLLFWQGAYTVFCIALLITVFAVIKLDFDYQSTREAQADSMLEHYKEAIAASPYDIENMADNIPNLYSLNRIYALYLEQAPWYTLSFMPSSSIMDEVKAAYFEELSQVLLPSLENTLEKDLFVYVSLEDQAKTLSLLNNYRLLFDPKRTNIEELKSYFMSALREQGEADTVNLSQLNILLDDVFAQNLVPAEPNYDLETLAKKLINQTGIETLLYKHILNSPTYSKRINVRPELGGNFSQLMNFSHSYAGYMVPYLYTPSGFNDLDLSVDSPVLAEALRAYEGVAGNSPSAIEMYRISRNLKQMYQNDYIHYWRDMISHIHVNEINNPDTLNHTLSLLTSTSDNPLARLYTTISKYTSVEIERPQAQGKDTDTLPSTQDSDKKEMAQQIYTAFTPYHQQVIADDQSTKPVDTLLGQFSEMKSWLEKFLSTKTPQEIAFNTLTAELKLSNPISVLVANAAKQPALSRSIISNITQQANEMVISLAHSYLNNSWQSEVFDAYQNTIAPYYPFNKSSSLDAATNDVTSFFKSNGVLDKFYQSKLKGFSTDERSPFLDGLLPNTGLALDPNVWQMFDKAADIRNALFLQDPQNLSLQFQLKALEMSPDLTQFSIVAEKSLFTYRHGPKLWSKQNWSAKDVDKDSINFQLRSQDVQVADEKFTGSWAWFKLIEPRVISATSQSTRVKFSYKDSQVELNIKTQGQNNPFVPNFFSAFALPASI